jgi:hypothetical protein
MSQLLERRLVTRSLQWSRRFGVTSQKRTSRSYHPTSPPTSIIISIGRRRGCDLMDSTVLKLLPLPQFPYPSPWAETEQQRSRPFKWHHNLLENRFFTGAILLATLALTSSVGGNVRYDRAARPLALRLLYTPKRFGRSPRDSARRSTVGQ